LASEIDRIGSDSATKLKNCLVLPRTKLCKSWNMGFDKIFPCFNLIEIDTATDLLAGMFDVAWLRIPKPYDLAYPEICIFSKKCHGETLTVALTRISFVKKLNY
jgi:hypothetical protein